LRGDRAVFAEGVCGRVLAGGEGAGEFTAGGGNVANILRAVGLDEHEDGAAIGGKTRPADIAIEFQGEDFFFASGGGGNG